ncbi:hypothetical protein KY362_07985 [Candidatus Woesearchaeota archaeon]|nr:hypothetical protein [Candidatus Woesearchaeota archaeon]
MGEAVSRPVDREEDSVDSVHDIPRIAIIGIGKASSSGYVTAFNLAQLSSLDPELDPAEEGKKAVRLDDIALNNRDEPEDGRIHRLVKSDFASVQDRVHYSSFSDICENYDLVFLCFGKGIGAAKGNFHDRLPAEARRAMFNANIGSAMNYATKFAGTQRDDQKYMIWTNPIDLITYFFNRQYQEVRDIIWEFAHDEYHSLDEIADRLDRQADLSAADSPDSADMTEMDADIPPRYPVEGQITGANHLDRYRAAYILGNMIKERHPQLKIAKVDAMLVGPHNRRMRLIPEESYVSIEDEIEPVLINEFLSKDEIEAAEQKIRLEGDKLIKDSGTSSVTTAASAVELVQAMYTGKISCELSMPYSVGDGLVKEEIFIGLPALFDDGWNAKRDNTGMLSIETDPEFIAGAEGILREIRYLERRQRELKAFLRGDDLKIADFPKFFSELVIPYIEDNGDSSLRFFNFTEPFNCFAEVREPVRLHSKGDPGYIDSLVIRGHSLLGVAVHEGIELVDPVKGTSIPYAPDSDKTLCNGCCSLDDRIIASVGGKGLFISDREGKSQKMKSLDMPAEALEGFRGHVKAHNNMLYFFNRHTIFECSLDKDDAVRIENTYDMPGHMQNQHQEISGFTVSDRQIDDNKIETRIFMTVHPDEEHCQIGTGYCLPFIRGGDAGRPVFDESRDISRRGTGQTHRPSSPSAAYVFDKPSLIIQLNDRIYSMDIDSRKPEDLPLLSKAAGIARTHELRTVNSVSSAAGGVVILAEEREEGTKNFKRNKLYLIRPSDGKKGVEHIRDLQHCFRENMKIMTTYTIGIYNEFTG